MHKQEVDSTHFGRQRQMPLNRPPFFATSPRFTVSRSCPNSLISNPFRPGGIADASAGRRVSVLSTSCSHPQLAGSRRFPYKATVAVDDVYVRSGPGQNYYPTDKLKRGQEVEVYRHDPGGWCAIRPVEGSFTWVSGRFLKPTGDHLAVVTEEGVSARVGSRFSDIRDVVQVRLHKGEVVEILEAAAARRRGENGVVQDRPALGRVPLGVGQVSRRRLSPRRRAKARRPARKRADRPDGDTPPRRPVGAADESSAPARPGRGRLRPRSSRRNWNASSWTLSMMVIEEPTAWSFDSLRERTERVAGRGADGGRAGPGPAAGQQDRPLRRHQAASRRGAGDARARPTGAAGCGPACGPGTPMAGRPAAKFETDGRFDGVGQLTQVVSPKLGAPALCPGRRSRARCAATSRRRRA